MTVPVRSCPRPVASVRLSTPTSWSTSPCCSVNEAVVPGRMIGTPVPAPIAEVGVTRTVVLSPVTATMLMKPPTTMLRRAVRTTQLGHVEAT